MNDEAVGIYGPNNPHPLATRKTELVWEGKYDAFGANRARNLSGLSMPLQRIETVDEPRVRAESQGGLFDTKGAHVDDFRNRLIWGENKLVLASSFAEFAGAFQLIYIDPPFDVGADFTMRVPIGDLDEMAEKDQSALEMVAYRDMWGRGTDSYLEIMAERLVLIRDLLAEDGSLLLHCDYRLAPYFNLLCDEVFGPGDRRHANDVPGFRSEIIWIYGLGGSSPKTYPKKHDTILWYTKGSSWYFDPPRVPATSQRMKGQDKKAPDTWDIPSINNMAEERTGFPTQKPEELLSRIIRAHSRPGDLVGDFFCGSGTTAAVAEREGRRWVVAELGRFAVHTTRKRLIEVQRSLNVEGKPYRAFDVLNLGRYERQWWQQELLQGADEDHRRVVLEFYRAEILANSPSSLIHGRKGTSLCHIDHIDSTFTREEARAVAEAAKEMGSREVTCLAWEFEMDLRILCDALESELGIKIHLIQIPREIMEKNRREPPPFLEVATLMAEPIYHEHGAEKAVDIALTQFIPSLAEVPTSELEVLSERAIRSGFDFIDYWAVDFDFRSPGPFKHQWQDFRTRKHRNLQTTSSQRHVYPDPGLYRVCVKVVDIFGCDTSVTLQVAV